MNQSTNILFKYINTHHLPGTINLRLPLKAEKLFKRLLGEGNQSVHGGISHQDGVVLQASHLCNFSLMFHFLIITKQLFHGLT